MESKVKVFNKFQCKSDIIIYNDKNRHSNDHSSNDIGGFTNAGANNRVLWFWCRVAMVAA